MPETNKQLHATLASRSAKRLTVDADKGILTDVLLMEGNREATGHGFWIDDKTLETALAAVNATGGQVRGYYTHDHRGGWMGGLQDFTEESGSEMAIPGYFSALRIEKSQLIAGQFTFYDSFRSGHPDVVAQIIEMATKTPDLLAQSLELWGYAVYVGKDGNEYGEPPKGVEVANGGMPVMRVTDVFGSAFVATGAATDGLFARLSRKLAGRSEATDVSALKKIFAEWSAEEIEKRKQESDTEMINLKALKAAIKDEARLTRALTIVASGDAETLTVESVVAMLDTEDAKAQSAAAAAAIEKAKTLEAELAAEKAKAAEAEAKLAKVATLGVEKPLAPSIGQASERFTGLTAKLAPKYAEKGINLTIGGIADMIVPEIWVQGMADEPIVEKNEIMDSNVVAAAPLFTRLASGAGQSANIPFFKEPDFTDAIQAESTEPTINKISQIKTVAPILNREYAFGATALAVQASGTDPLGSTLRYIQRIRNRQRKETMRNILFGAFGSHTDTTAALDSMRLNKCTTTGSLVTSGATSNYLNLRWILDAAALLGENIDMIVALWVHPEIQVALTDMDVTDFVTPSDGALILKGYRNCRIYVDKNLKTTATINSVPSVPIYRTYLMSAATVARGEKPQSTNIGDVASMTTKADAATNDRKVYDRTRFLMGLNGLSWKGTPSGESATNAELATITNWELAKNGDTTFDARNCGVAELITNG
ncbi:MAG: hypothetical protein ABFC56_14605 [Clostridiaceae bacterium]